jgi:acyl-CoA reductase-like NAD-dependent aldehyde dehydrogenase
MKGLTISADPNARVMTFREPVGVVGLIHALELPAGYGCFQARARH